MASLSYVRPRLKTKDIVLASLLLMPGSPASLRTFTFGSTTRAMPLPNKTVLLGKVTDSHL